MSPSGIMTARKGRVVELISSLLFLLFFIAIFYFMLIRPQRRRQQEHKALIESLKRGDEVVTAGGIFGKIKKVDGDKILLEVEEGITLKILKDSIMERVKS